MKEENFDFDDELDGSDDFSSETDSSEDTDTVVNERKPAGLLDKIKGSIIYIVIGVVVIGVGGYLIYDALGPSTPARTQVRHQQTQGLGMSPVNVVRETKVVKERSGNTEMTGVSQAELKALAKGLTNEIRNNDIAIAKQIKILQSEIVADNKSNAKQNTIIAEQNKEIYKVVSGLGSSLSANNAYLQGVKKGLLQTQSELKLLVAERAAAKQKLTLRAVVPGRAWLVNGKGKTITVTTGQKMQYYGKVMTIDSKDNKVYMSSGYVFS